MLLCLSEIDARKSSACITGINIRLPVIETAIASNIMAPMIRALF